MKPLAEQNYIQQLSIDCVIIGFRDRRLFVLLPKLNLVGDFWALPAGYIHQDEGIDQAARRILEERTGIKDVYLEQFRVFGAAGRSIVKVMKEIKLKNERIGGTELTKADFEWLTKRFVSIGYYALVDFQKVTPQKTDTDESIEWYAIGNLPHLIIDHQEIVNTALEVLRQNLDRVGFYLLPEKFTMKEVQELYETVLDKPFARNNFQKKILDLNALERLEKKFTGAANKAPYLYRLRK